MITMGEGGKGAITCTSIMHAVAHIANYIPLYSACGRFQPQLGGGGGEDFIPLR